MMVFRLLPLIADAGDFPLSGGVVKLHDHPVSAKRRQSRMFSNANVEQEK